jgi:hypothetical protein
MKRILPMLLLLALTASATAQQIAYTQDGKRIVLFANGHWMYADSLYGGGGGGWGGQWNGPLQSASDIYSEAYDYAFEVVYGDEFFRQDRENKSATWAADYLKSNIQIVIGARRLEMWFDELYGVAYNSVFKNVFFSTERKQNAINWARNLIEQKATYDNFYQGSSRFGRYRDAYNVALNKIFVTEFFSNDRKKRAAEWANNFVRNRR